MEQPYILAAINREQLDAACRITADHRVVVLGTMDGEKIQRFTAGKPGSVPYVIYFYEPG